MDHVERFFAGMVVTGMICLCAAFADVDARLRRREQQIHVFSTGKGGDPASFQTGGAQRE